MKNLTKEELASLRRELYDIMWGITRGADFHSFHGLSRFAAHVDTALSCSKDEREMFANLKPLVLATDTCIAEGHDTDIHAVLENRRLRLCCACAFFDLAIKYQVVEGMPDFDGYDEIKIPL